MDLIYQLRKKIAMATDSIVDELSIEDVMDGDRLEDTVRA